MKKQVKVIFYTFRPNKQSPLDDRQTVSSLAAIATELPLAERYAGLIFWVTDIETFYCFEEDLNTPINFRESIVSSDTKGIVVAGEDYSGLLATLNALDATSAIGQLVSVFPLGVTYKFDGTVWTWAFGDYSVSTAGEFNAIDNSLKRVGARVIVGSVINIIKSDFSLSTEVIVVSSKPVTPENDRYYLVNGILYYSVGGGFYKIGSASYVAAGIELAIGDTVITHNLNSPYIRGIFWINSLSTLAQLSLTYVDANNSSVNSRTDQTGTIVLIADN